MTASLVKCVVWDIDNTLLDGVWLEAAEQLPAADSQLTGVLHELAARGILHAIASRNPLEAARYAARITGHDFAAVHCGWDAKSAGIRAIMADLRAGGDIVGGPAPFAKSDRSRFLSTLDEAVSRLLRIGK